MTPHEMLDVAVAEARKGLAEGGIPIGAALFSSDGTLLGSGHNRRVQQDDPSVHAETDAQGHSKLPAVDVVPPMSTWVIGHAIILACVGGWLFYVFRWKPEHSN